MAANTRGEQVICYLCEQEFDSLQTTNVCNGDIYRFCEECVTEFQTARDDIEHELVRTRKYKIKKWLRERRAVKRFYRRQLPLLREGTT